MNSDDGSQGFWTSLSGILTALVVLLTAGACVLFVFVQTGVLGEDDSVGASPTSEAPTSPATTPTTPSVTATEAGPTEPAGETTASGSEGPGATLAGTWTGTAASADGDFDVVLTIEPGCALRKPCGSIHVSSAPCTGRVRLWDVEGATYEFYVDRFSDDSSADCSPGPGELFEQVDADHLRYTTDYSDAVGVLQRG
jgi:hypothetical protein